MYILYEASELINSYTGEDRDTLSGIFVSLIRDIFKKVEKEYSKNQEKYEEVYDIMKSMELTYGEQFILDIRTECEEVFAKKLVKEVAKEKANIEAKEKAKADQKIAKEKAKAEAKAVKEKEAMVINLLPMLDDEAISKVANMSISEVEDIRREYGE